MKKRLLVLLAPVLLTFSSWAATLNIVEVSGPSINCLFSPTCTLQVSNDFSEINLPGTVGTGFLQTRVFLGEAGSAGEGLYGYEYRIDLTGVTADPNVPPCFTNAVRCITNRVELTNHLVTCFTNPVGVSNLVTCLTNVFPGTNLVFCLTNQITPTNIVRCVTNAGGITCFTNFFPSTNAISCVTNRIPARTNIVCQTNRITGTNLVVCLTNHVRRFTNVVNCYTNRIPCPGTTPCIETLRLRFGPVFAGLNVSTGGMSGAQVYVVTNGGVGTIRPVSVQQVGADLLLQFVPPICPGESSYLIGLVSTNPPTDIRSALTLTSGSNLVVGAVGPRFGRAPIACDLTALEAAIRNLRLADIVAPNNNAREGRRGALLNLVAAARHAADAGQLENVLEAVGALIKKASGERNSWLTAAAAQRLSATLDELLRCLEKYSRNGDDGEHHDDDGEDHHDDDDDDDDHDDDDHDDDDDDDHHGNRGNRGNHGRGHGNK